MGSTAHRTGLTWAARTRVGMDLRWGISLRDPPIETVTSGGKSTLIRPQQARVEFNTSLNRAFEYID